MSAADLRVVLEERVEIGSHTRSHPLLTALPQGELAAEINGSREDLRLARGAAFCASGANDHRRDAAVAGFPPFTTEDRATTTTAISASRGCTCLGTPRLLAWRGRRRG
jgi:peptidoglycan/xylan/chitin deacetylase (PgdA/CDA1 family)